jgi:cytoskeleton protein RodZ
MGVDKGIGTTLREARKRRGIDLSEVESQTKIRLRYLRAIENEEWDVLPGGAYTRAFIRTYGTHLGLDGERLAEDFRRESADRAPARPQPLDAAPPIRRLGGRPSGLSRRSWTAIATVGAIAVLVAIAVAIGGGGSSPTGGLKHRGKPARENVGAGRSASQPHRGVGLRVLAEAEIWVCLLNAAGEPLIDGQILEGGVEEGPFHSAGYTVSFGNGEVTMLIDGRRTEVPPTAEPVGYEINSRGELTPLEEGERPTCT